MKQLLASLSVSHQMNGKWFSAPEPAGRGFIYSKRALESLPGLRLAQIANACAKLLNGLQIGNMHCITKRSGQSWSWSISP